MREPRYHFIDKHRGARKFPNVIGDLMELLTRYFRIGSISIFLPAPNSVTGGIRAPKTRPLFETKDGAPSI